MRVDDQQKNFNPSRKVFLSPRTEEQRLQIPVMNSGNPPRNDGEKSDDGFVAVNVAELGVAVDRPPATPRTMSKSLSRKGGPPRSGSGSGGGEAVSIPTLDGPGVKDKPLYVAVEGDAEVAATAAAAINRHRRAATGRRPSAWRDPRRVLLVFASLVWQLGVCPLVIGRAPLPVHRVTRRCIRTLAKMAMVWSCLIHCVL